MDSRVQKQTVAAMVPLFPQNEELVISSDFVLPEYCPDIAVVLKCIVAPRIQNRQWSSGQLLLDGITVIRALYLDEERRCVRATEFSQPFSVSMRAAEAAQDPMVRVDILPEYVNCRATSPRRLEVRGAFTVCAAAHTMHPTDIMMAEDRDGFCMRTAQHSCSVPHASAERVTALNEVFDFPSDLPSAELLLGGDCYACVQECKVLTGKVIVKGQVYIHQMYTDDTSTGDVYTLDYALPFSQILDVDGVTEGTLCTADASILSDIERCCLNAAGQNAAMEVAIKLLVQVQTYRCDTVDTVVDVYHRRCPLDTQMQELSLRTFMGVQRQNVTVQRTLELPASDLRQIVDVWVQAPSLIGRCEDGTVHLEGRMLVCMLVRDAEGMASYYERPEDVHLELPACCDTVIARATVCGVNYTSMDGRLDLRVTLAVNTELWQHNDCRAVGGVTLREKEAYPPERASLRLYYAQAGERVWDIARQCHTSPEGICRENDLHDDVLMEKKVLLVPVACP